MRVIAFVTIGLIAIGVLVASARLGFFAYDHFGLDEKTRARQVQALVDDGAMLLTPEQRDQIIEFHAAILTAYDIDFRVATEPGDIDLNMSAASRFLDLKIGELSTAGRGLFLMIAPDTNQVRIEVGRGLEPVFTDAFVAYIENRQMVPFFEADRVADGVLATTELIADRAGDGIETAAFSDLTDGAAEPSTGAGARTNVQIGSGYARPEGSSAAVSAEGLGPVEVVATYLEAMAARNSDPNLDIFTDDTRKMMRAWVTTPAQMTQISRTYRKCRPPRVFQESQRAIVRYEAIDRACAPFFLHLTEVGWQLDLKITSTAIQFNHKNEWHFSGGPPLEFAFAFKDWSFDRHGFPH